MDIKIMGITAQIMREALAQAQKGRFFLLDAMDAVIAAPSQEKSKYAPRIHTIQIPTDKIRDLIGPGGKVIRGIIDATGVKIDVDDTGRVNVASSDAEGLAKAIQMISDLTAVPEVGKTYLGKVVRLAEFGAFVEIFPGTDGLLHVSEIAEHRVKEVKDELREGDQVLVKVLAIEGNRIKLSRKAVLREQRAKLGLPEVPEGAGDGGRGERGERGERQDRGERSDRGQRNDRTERTDRGERSERNQDRPERAPRPERTEHPAPESTITLEGGADFDDDEEDLEIGDESDTEEGEDAVPAAAGSGAAEGGSQAAAGGQGQRRRRRRGGRRGGSGGTGSGGQQGGGNR
jgi:polyribonucleotide nucleotidyltransferase